MGKVIGWLLLFGLCALAWAWQGSWSDAIRAERDSLRRTPAGLEERERSWGRVTIGRPSGSEPLVELPRATEAAPPPAGDAPPEPFLRRPTAPAEPAPASPEEDATEWAADAEYIVPRGQVLSKLCQDYYGSGRPPIPERLAEYNGLKSPDDVREGQVLRLPEWEVLFPEGRERP